MKKLSTVAILLVFVVAAAATVRMSKASGARDDKAAITLGAVVSDFTLPDADGHRDQRFKSADVAIVVAVESQMVVETVERERRFGSDAH